MYGPDPLLLTDRCSVRDSRARQPGAVPQTVAPAASWMPSAGRAGREARLGVEEQHRSARHAKADGGPELEAFVGRQLGHERALAEAEVREALVAEVLDDLDDSVEAAQPSCADPTLMCSGRKPASSESGPRPGAGREARFIAGEPMKVATKVLPGRV